MYKDKFSKNLRALREQAGFSQTHIAKEIGLSARQVSYLESGTNEPGLDTLVKISRLFDVTVDELLGLKE